MPGLRLLALAGAAAAFDGRPAAFRRAVSLRAVDAADAPAVDAAAPADAAAAAATPFRAGFVAIVGSANVGKSTLTNALVGQELCIATRKPQTTRHRILGIVNGENYQLILSDTPGVIDTPAYELHRGMMASAKAACRDAEAVVLLTDIYEAREASSAIVSWIAEQLPKRDLASVPILIGVNKVDECLDEAAVVEALKLAGAALPGAVAVVGLSAKDGRGVAELKAALAALLPESPRLFPDEYATDRPERFFAAEMVRKAVLENYRKEIPYSCEVRIESFKEPQAKGDVLRISATVVVARDSHKGIVIGKDGAAIKKLGIAARAELEKFFEQKIMLEIRVKVSKDWRDDANQLRSFGYPV